MAQDRGHIICAVDDQPWKYSDTDELFDSDNPRACIKCNRYPTKDGHDACIANLPGVQYACCGHGVEPGYIKFVDGQVIRFNLLETSGSAF